MQLALEGRMTDHHRWLLRVLWAQLSRPAERVRLPV
jgi:hypothetical protein